MHMSMAIFVSGCGKWSSFQTLVVPYTVTYGAVAQPCSELHTHTILRTKEYYLMLLVCSLVSLPLSCVCACKFSCFMSLWQVWHSWGKKTSKNKTNSKAKSNFLNSYWHTANVIIHWLFSREFAKNSVQTRASYVHPIPNDVLSMLPVRRIHPQLRSARVIFASCVAPPEETLSRKIDLSMELSCNSRCA